MNPSEDFILRLQGLQKGERTLLRRLSAQPLNADTDGFDLFTGLWWPLRDASPRSPRRETSWLVAKLFCRHPLRHMAIESAQGYCVAPFLLGLLEPVGNRPQDRYRKRFDALILSHLSTIEQHMDWVFGRLRAAARRLPSGSLDWAILLDDLSLWDRSINPRDPWQQSRLNLHAQRIPCCDEHLTIQDLWACEYTHALNH